MSRNSEKLDDLREEIDRIDDKVHDLLMRRVEIGREVGNRKGHDGLALRPAREAQILRRLTERHSGAMPKADLVQIWKEVLGSSVRQQGPFSVAVCEGGGCRVLARDQFGARTPITGFESARRVVEAVTKGDASVGVLPLPLLRDPNPWWRFMVNEAEGTPRVVSRLPWAGAPSGMMNEEAEAVVIANLNHEPSGQDRSLFVFDAEAEFNRASIDAALYRVGLTATFSTLWYDTQKPRVWLHLVEIDDFATPGDERLQTAAAFLGTAVKRVVALGGYAVPLTHGDLADL
ncbi:chorismate mutase [Magnetospira sp. QH-2]|uniref:chorismate mutase n=1 Tax=Magnetospira sp. (strain QH-2) TaxID=1288970 RepID=UPI0003E80B49|nr:chorismate mutase [Magnetospira sp. QH-2]CCQ74817.1 putative Chorismate mutase [Magnetospira sp. QH-2]